jgi:hypothetical protein
MSKHYFYIITGGVYKQAPYSLFITKKICHLLKPHWKIKILGAQFAQEVIMDQYLEQVMIYSYLIMRLQIPVHTQILIPTTKLHLVSMTQTPSWQEPTNFNHQKSKFPYCLELISIYICALNILISQTKFKVLMHRNMTPLFMIACCKENSNWPNKSLSQTILSRFSTRQNFSLSCDFSGGIK